MLDTKLGYQATGVNSSGTPLDNLVGLYDGSSNEVYWSSTQSFSLPNNYAHTYNFYTNGTGSVGKGLARRVRLIRYTN